MKSPLFSADGMIHMRVQGDKLEKHSLREHHNSTDVQVCLTCMRKECKGCTPKAFAKHKQRYEEEHG